MIDFIKRQWFWFQVAVGLRERPSPITPEMVAKAALDHLERQIAANPGFIVRAGHVIVHHPAFTPGSN